MGRLKFFQILLLSRAVYAPGSYAQVDYAPLLRAVMRADIWHQGFSKKSSTLLIWAKWQPRPADHVRPWRIAG